MLAAVLLSQLLLVVRDNTGLALEHPGDRAAESTVGTPRSDSVLHYPNYVSVVAEGAGSEPDPVRRHWGTRPRYVRSSATIPVSTFVRSSRE